MSDCCVCSHMKSRIEISSFHDFDWRRDLGWSFEKIRTIIFIGRYSDIFLGNEVGRGRESLERETACWVWAGVCSINSE